MQSISGTGALRIGGAFFQRFFPHTKTIYIPNPSWGNHTAVFRDSGLEVKQYRYFDKKTVGLDFEGMKEDLRVRSTVTPVLFCLSLMLAEHSRQLPGSAARMCAQPYWR